MASSRGRSTSRKCSREPTHDARLAYRRFEEGRAPQLSSESPVALDYDLEAAPIASRSAIRRGGTRPSGPNPTPGYPGTRAW